MELSEEVKAMIEKKASECLDFTINGDEQTADMKKVLRLFAKDCFQDAELLSKTGYVKKEDWMEQVDKIVKNLTDIEGDVVKSGNYHKAACYIRLKSGNGYIISIRAEEKMILHNSTPQNK